MRGFFARRAVLKGVRSPSPSQQHNSCIPEAYRRDFSVYTGLDVDFKCSYANRPLKPLNRLMARVCLEVRRGAA
jgi:hypothetical protein